MSEKQFKKRQPVDETVATLSADEIEMMMKTVIRREDVFVTVRGQLTAEILGSYNEMLFVIWLVIDSHYARHGRLPMFQTLRTDLKSHCATHKEGSAGTLSEDELTVAIQFCREAYKVRVEDYDPVWAIGKVRDFLEERLLANTKKALEQEDRRPTDLPNFLRQMHVASEAISSLQGDELDLPFPTGWEPIPLAVQSTGIDFLDEFLGGGDAAGEVNSMIGPTGGCKTTVVNQLGSKRAEQYWMQHCANPSAPKKMTFIVPYESPVEPELRQRILMCHACVRREEMEGHGEGEKLGYGWSGFSTSATPKTYELEMFKQELEDCQFRGERERIEDSMTILNSNLRFIDCSGADLLHPRRGGGYVEELVTILKGELAKHPDWRVGTVIIDYAGVMVTKHLAATGKDYSQLRHHLGNLPMLLRDQLALPMNASVWLMHQLAGAANAKSPWAPMHHTDSQECKTIGDNCSFAFALGNIDANGHCIIRCTKHRRQPRHGQKIIRVDGAMARVRSTQGDYYYDEHRKQIMNVAEAQKIMLAEDVRPAVRAGSMQMPRGHSYEQG